jgi:riboflavin synthase
MFTGIVEERGEVVESAGGRLTVSSTTVADGLEIGASVAVNGVCLTLAERGETALSFDLSPETRARSALGELSPGGLVNLERPVTLASRLGGHLVQGHVDGTGTIIRVSPSDGGGAVVRLAIPIELLRSVIEKGSITVDGVSLTVAELHGDGVTIALIPHTLAATNLGTVRAGDRVNLEVDIIARYVERLMEGARR